MRFAPPRRALTRSLRFRLMVWNAAVVIVTACVTLVALREGVRITLVRELDQLLQEDVNEIVIAIGAHEDAATLHEQLDRKAAGHAAHHWFAELSDDRGQVQYRSQPAPPLPPAAPGSLPFRTVNQWRVLSRAVPASPVTIRVGASLAMIHNDIARLDRIVALAAAGVLLVAPPCGYWLAGRATRPLAKIIQTTDRLRPTQLDERLEIRGTGDELDQLSAKFNRLLDHIGQYLQEHRDFLANSAHELRTPLAAIRTSIEVALGRERTKSEYQELLTEIIEESASLEVLVNQLLLLSETEAERLKVDQHHVRLDEIVTRSLDMFSGVAEANELELRNEPLAAAVVQGNQQHLRQVVCNLLDNALKFTPPGGRVAVRLLTSAANSTAMLTVEDSGAGIPAGELPHIFDRFFQGHRPRSAGAEKRGTGLGLSICQKIVQAHGGTIRVNSAVGQGTCFTVQLPLADSSVTSAPHSLTSSTADPFQGGHVG